MSNWELIESIIDSVLQLPAESRELFIEKHYGENERLKNEVLDLLRAIEDSDAFFLDASKAKEDIFSEFAGKNGDAYTDNSLAGTVIGKYKIEELISHGGMGTVYLAERNDGMYEQKVALKVLRRGMDTPSNISRFEQERNILAGLSHPNIARLLDGGMTSFGLPYLVMEFVDGLPIDEYCDRQHLSIRERITLFKTICEAVQFAHNSMIIHRDLKPDNIFVDRNGTIKILDFGIAKLLQDDANQSSHLTQNTQQVLTPSCASPEQVAGESVTAATDTYALGSLLYRMLAGTTPFNFDGASLMKQKRMITDTIPLPPSETVKKLPADSRKELAKKRNSTPGKLIHDLSGDIDAIIQKSLRKEKESRYQTANELSNDRPDDCEDNCNIEARDEVGQHRRKLELGEGLRAACAQRPHQQKRVAVDALEAGDG
jgi:serine/threonine-protein kinase